MHRLWVGQRKADGATVGVACRLAIDGRNDHEHAPILDVDQLALVIEHACAGADGGEQRIVEATGDLHVVGSDGDVTEHAGTPLRESPSVGHLTDRRNQAGITPY
ncbi:hypothetical protein D3C72_2036520 [compost metagenome]